MTNTPQPHDKYFKRVFSIPQVIKDAIDQIFPEEVSKNIDRDSLSVANNSHVDPKLNEHFSDLTYHCLWKGKTESELCLIWEHKSYPDHRVMIQLNQYFLNALRHQIKQKEQLKPVIIVLFYHGKKKWNPKSFEKYFGEIDNELLKFIPKFECIFIDLSTFSDDQILALRAGFLVNSLITLKHKSDKKYILQYPERIFIYHEEYYQTKEGTDFMFVTFRYLIETVGMEEEEIVELIEILPPKIKKMARTAYQNILEKGKEIHARQTAIGLLLEFPEWSDERIAKMAQASLELVKEIRKEIKNKK